MRKWHKKQWQQETVKRRWLSLDGTFPRPQACISWSINHLQQMTSRCSTIHSLKFTAYIQRLSTWEDTTPLAKVSGHFRPLARAIWAENNAKKNIWARLIYSDHYKLFRHVKGYSKDPSKQGKRSKADEFIIIGEFCTSSVAFVIYHWDVTHPDLGDS